MPDLTDEQSDLLVEPSYKRGWQVVSSNPSALLPLIGDLRLALDGAEAGAPMTDPDKPLVSGKPWEMVSTALGTSEAEAVLQGWMDLMPLMSLASMHGAFEPGRYSLRNVTAEQLYEQVRGYDGMTPERAGLDQNGEVTVSPDHLALLRNLQWQWTHHEFAADILFFSGGWPGPAVDAKRVYAEMSYIELDMHRILGMPVEARTDEGYIAISDTQQTRLTALHLSILPATQVFVENVALDLSSQAVADTLAQWEAWLE